MRRLRRGGTPDRRGRHQKRILSAFVGYGPVLSTRDLAKHVWPRLDPDKRWPCWRWYLVRRSAEHWADRVEPRTRPLLWRVKPGVLPDESGDKSP
jgi:hypothetical protein